MMERIKSFKINHGEVIGSFEFITRNTITVHVGKDNHTFTSVCL